MKREEAKAEAEKIIQEIIPIIDPDFGKVIKKTTMETARKLAILQVKVVIRNKPLLPSTEGWYETTQDVVDDAVSHWQSILTELERTK